MAFKKVLRLPFDSSMKGSFIGYFFEPHRTVCSMICGTPVESVGVVLKPTENTLFLSSFEITQILAPDFLCLSTAAFEVISSRYSSYITSYSFNFFKFSTKLFWSFINSFLSLLFRTRKSIVLLLRLLVNQTLYTLSFHFFNFYYKIY